MYASSADVVHIIVLLCVYTFVNIYSVYVAYLLCSIMVLTSIICITNINVY